MYVCVGGGGRGGGGGRTISPKYIAYVNLKDYFETYYIISRAEKNALKPWRPMVAMVLEHFSACDQVIVLLLIHVEVGCHGPTLSWTKHIKDGTSK